MAAPSGAGLSTVQRLSRTARWWAARTQGTQAEILDTPEVVVLYSAVSFALGLGLYSIKRGLLNNDAGSYTNINMRGDPEKQVETARVGWEDPAAGKHSLFWHVAQVKTDENGANISVLPWDNRTRLHQYSKPGAAGIGAGQSMTAGAGV